MVILKLILSKLGSAFILAATIAILATMCLYAMMEDSKNEKAARKRREARKARIV